MMKRKPGTSREIAGERREDLGHNPYVFIVGCSRSGTTLLQRLVDAHPLIAITSQTNWVTRYFEMKTGLTPEGLVTPEMIPRLIEYHRFPFLGIDREDNGLDLSQVLRLGPSLDDISTGPRVGLRLAADRPWRFWITGDPTVSRYVAAKPKPKPRPEERTRQPRR